MLQHLVHRVRVPLLTDNSVTAPSGSLPKAAVADAKIRGRGRENPWSHFQEKKKQKKQQIQDYVTGAIKAELNNSLWTPPADSETGPLWCKLREVNSPRVCQLAKNYPCIPPTGTPAERVFSTCGNIGICHPVGQHQSQIQ